MSSTTSLKLQLETTGARSVITTMGSVDRFAPNCLPWRPWWSSDRFARVVVTEASRYTESTLDVISLNVKFCV